MFAAAKGEGTTCNDEPIQVSAVAELHKSVMVTGFPYDHDRHGAVYAAVVGTVLEQVNGIRRSGSAALDFAWLAAGRFDGYWEFSLGAWDMAAGVLLVTEAGGIVTDAYGEAAFPGVPHLVAANAHLHQKLRTIVEPIVPQHVLS